MRNDLIGHLSPELTMDTIVKRYTKINEIGGVDKIYADFLSVFEGVMREFEKEQ